MATRWFTVLPSSTVNAMIPILSQVTFAMVVFDIGMSMKMHDVLSEGKSAIARTVLYMAISISGIALLFTVGLHWDLYQALFLGSVVGGEVSMIIVPFLARRISQYGIFSNLALESVVDSLVLIILFTVLLNGYNQGAPLDLEGLTVISKSFFQELSIGLVAGVLLGLGWVRVTKSLGHSDFFYVATVGYVLLTYVLVGQIGGSGVITALGIGLVMKNFGDLPASLGVSVAVPAVSLNYISTFQSEISFFLRTFFLFFVGFSLPASALSSPIVSFESLMVLGILAAARYVSTEAVDSRKSAKDRRLIESMMAEGMTPALLATTLIAYSVSGSAQILPIAALVIIFTNVVAAVGVRLLARPSQGLDLGTLSSIAPLVGELSGMVEGLDQDQLEKWLNTVEDDAKESAPGEVRERVSIPRIDVRKKGARVTVSRSAIPYLVGAIRKNEPSMPQGVRSYFEALDDLLSKQVSKS